MNTFFIAFVINYCIFCDQFKQNALPGILAKPDYEVVVYNYSEQRFEHGYTHDINYFVKHVSGYPSFVIVEGNTVLHSWQGYEEYNFWLNYNQFTKEKN